MAEKLGIFVNTDRHWEHLVETAKAAVSKGKELNIFFSHRGVLLTRRPEFAQLADVVNGYGKMSLCLASWDSFDLGDDHSVPGIAEEDFGTQSRHGELVEEMDRYLVM